MRRQRRSCRQSTGHQLCRGADPALPTRRNYHPGFEWGNRARQSQGDRLCGDARLLCCGRPQRHGHEPGRATPWQAQKLYVHLYPTNRLFHQFWETPYPALTGLTAHQAANTGLTCHVSQGPLRWIGASVYPPEGMYNLWPAEWWGLYANSVRQGGCCLGHTSSTGNGLEILTSLSGDKSVELRSKAKAPPLGSPGLKSPVNFSAKFFGDSVLWPAHV